MASVKMERGILASSVIIRIQGYGDAQSHNNMLSSEKGDLHKRQLADILRWKQEYL